ncbi:MAG: glutamine synthetase, partial [Ruminococcus sp.]
NICLSIKKNGTDILGSDEGNYFIAGILNRIPEMTAFLNPSTNSYKRFGVGYAPKYINWSFSNNSPLIRVSNANGESPSIEVRSADATCNPYIAFNLILSAGFEGIKNREELPPESETNVTITLPHSLEEAHRLASNSDFIKSVLNEKTRNPILNNISDILQEYRKSPCGFDEEKYFKYI